MARNYWPQSSDGDSETAVAVVFRSPSPSALGKGDRHAVLANEVQQCPPSTHE
jgi:hypothetical protein